jgi:transketolase
VNGLGQSQRTMQGLDVESFAAKFRAFGWYAAVVDGHDYAQILDAFARCRREAGAKPRVIVARTAKGKGVSLLENKEGWHGKPLPKEDLDKALAELSESYGPAEFHPNPRPRPERQEPPLATDIAVARSLGESAATREAYGDALAKLAVQNDRIVALDGDTKNSTFSEKVLKARPDRFFEMFIAEQNMAGVAAGMSARGIVPFASTFAAFWTRAFDQIRMAAVSRSNVKFCGSHAGVSIGEDGPSQMGLEDLAMFRAVPESVVLYPCDAVSTERLVAEAAKVRGICYIRTSRPKTPVVYKSDEPFPVGGSKVLRRSGEDRATVIGAGVTVHEALKAADSLAKEGISIRVVDAYSVKPLDVAAILACAKETGGNLVVVEDHYPEGGLGEAVSSAVGAAARVTRLAVREIPRSGPPEVLLDAYGISARHIVQAVKSLL